MTGENGGDIGPLEPEDPVAEVAALTEPFEVAFTDRVMEGINLRQVMHDSVEAQWPAWTGVLREYLELFFGLLGFSDKEDRDG